MTERTETIEGKCALIAGGIFSKDTECFMVVSMKNVIVFTTTKILAIEPSKSQMETIQDLSDEFDGSIEDLEVKFYPLQGEMHGRDLGKQ